MSIIKDDEDKIADLSNQKPSFLSPSSLNISLPFIDKSVESLAEIQEQTALPCVFISTENK